MAELITVARPYAEAVFRLSAEEGACQEWSDALAVLAYVAQDARVSEAVSNPKFTQQAVQQLLVDILGARTTDKVKNFITLILDNRRFVLLPLIAELFEAMRAKREGVAKAQIETAFAMDNSEVAELTTQLEKHFKQTVEAKVEVNPELIGGIRVTVGDEVIDASIRGKLSSLAASLKS